MLARNRDCIYSLPHSGPDAAVLVGDYKNEAGELTPGSLSSCCAPSEVTRHLLSPVIPAVAARSTRSPGDPPSAIVSTHAIKNHMLACH
jgi:hypothetical protein